MSGLVSLNEYVEFCRLAEEKEAQPPFKEEDVERAEYFSVSESEEEGGFSLKLHDADGAEIAESVWADSDFMLEYMDNFYGVEISEEDLDESMVGMGEPVNS